jgi:hypothetical protein
MSIDMDMDMDMDTDMGIYMDMDMDTVIDMKTDTGTDMDMDTDKDIFQRIFFLSDTRLFQSWYVRYRITVDLNIDIVTGPMSE